LYAIHANTGALLWKYQAGSRLVTQPTVVNGVVYTAPFTKFPFVYALSAKDGSLLWRAPLPESTTSPLTILDNVIYVSTSTMCCALSTDNGRLIWKQKVEGHVNSSPIVADNTMYISVSEYVFFPSNPPQRRISSIINALRISDGSILWKHFLDRGEESYLTAPAPANNKVYVGTSDGYLSVLQGTDGELLWKFQTYSTRFSTPIVENGIVLVGANDGYVYALQETNGNLLWRTFVSQTLSMSAVDREVRSVTNAP